MFTRRAAAIVVLSLFALMGGECVSIGFPIPPTPIDDFITVTVINNTDFDIDPMVDAEDFNFDVYLLDFGILFPGEIVSIDLFCDEAISLSSTNAEQYVFDEVWILDPLPIFELDFDYFCGEEVTFEFIGNGPDFDALVDANGEVIY